MTRQITARRAETRRRLLEAARTVFAARGISGASVEDICEAAGFTRGAFYSNFASKDELLFALMEHEKQGLTAEIEQIVAAGPTLGGSREDVLHQLVDRVLITQPSDLEWFLVHGELTLHALRNPAMARQLTQDDEEFRDRLADLLVAGLAVAGRRLTLPAREAVIAVMGLYEVAVRELLMAQAGAPTGGAQNRHDPMSARNAIAQVLTAMSVEL